jgi:hypothetical protein
MSPPQMASLQLRMASNTASAPVGNERRAIVTAASLVVSTRAYSCPQSALCAADRRLPARAASSAASAAARS